MTDELPKVALGGREWALPELGIRQLRKVRRPIIDLTDSIFHSQNETVGGRVMKLTEDQFDQMCDVVYVGLTRAEPELKKDAFENLTASDGDIFVAFLTVRRQSGIYVAVPVGEETSKPGEAAADVSNQTQTGIE